MVLVCCHFILMNYILHVIDVNVLSHLSQLILLILLLA